MLDRASGDVLWQALVGSLPFYVAIFSPDGRLAFRNQAWVPSTDRSRDAVLDPRVTALLDPAVARVFKTGAGETVEVPTPQEEGVTAWIRLHLTRLVAADDPIGVLAVGLDVTESKQAAIELRMSVNALHRLIEARERLAHDIHDGILQSLYGVGLRIEATKAAVKGSPDQTAPVLAHLQKAVGQLNETMAEIRGFIAGGEGTLPTGMRWEEAMLGVLHGLEAEGGPVIEVMVEREAAERVQEAHRSECLWIAREAVSNAVRHSGARRVMVRLFAEGHSTRLEVDDDGRGLSEKPVDGGLGILTMTHRASRIGATLTLHSTPNRGTLVRVDLGSGERPPG